MKDMLLKKKDELTKNIQKLEADLAKTQEMLIMHRGAVQYNQMLVDELEAEEKAKMESEVVKD